jgi:hypothetical protein
MALDQGDEDLSTLSIGKLFLEASPMLGAFKSYCTRQVRVIVQEAVGRAKCGAVGSIL